MGTLDFHVNFTSNGRRYYVEPYIILYYIIFIYKCPEYQQNGQTGFSSQTLKSIKTSSPTRRNNRGGGWLASAETLRGVTIIILIFGKINNS